MGAYFAALVGRISAELHEEYEMTLGERWVGAIVDGFADRSVEDLLLASFT